MGSTGAASTPRIEEIRALAAERRWPALVRALDGTPEARLLELPELAVHFADGLWRVGQAQRAAELARRVEPVLRSRGERALVLNVTNIHGIALFELGELDGAADVFSELMELADEWEDFEFSARACNNLGVHASVQNRYDEALVHYERALAAHIRVGSQRGIAQTHYNLAVNYRELGFHDKAESHYALAVAHADRAGSEDLVALAESERGLLRIQTGDPRLGRVFAGRARERFQRLSDPVREGEAVRVLGLAAHAEGDSRGALELFDEALQIAQRHGNRLLLADVQLERGRILLNVRDGDRAGEALADAVQQYEALGAEGRAAEARALLEDRETR